MARFYVDGVLFELVPTSERASLSGTGNARLTLAVDEFDQAVSGLREKGLAVSAVHQVSNGRFVTLTDPDGNEIVVWQYA